MVQADQSTETHSCVTAVLSSDLDLVREADELDDTYGENEGLDGKYTCPECGEPVAIHFDASIFWETDESGELHEVRP